MEIAFFWQLTSFINNCPAVDTIVCCCLSLVYIWDCFGWVMERQFNLMLLCSTRDTICAWGA